jgi:phosphatidylserine/phosphatidylglycerophosphate/cardiolipin synthase-like enzyme
MELLIQPGSGSAMLLDGINNATKSIELAIFRFDRREIEAALKAAVGRGVFVHALIAYTNRGGEKNLRKLEMGLLDAGITVARTSDDLARYHDKFMIIDRRVLYLLAFNYTYLDIDHTRSFGVVTDEASVVQEAGRLFEADATRQPYTSQLETFIVSPANARKQLSAFIERAQKQLWIYDPKISDKRMKTLLDERARAGVDVRIIGRLGKNETNLRVRQFANMRLHTRTMVRDGEEAFIGSQSLREAELDSRRELGILIREPEVVSSLLTTFESDWKAIGAETPQSDANAEATMPLVKAARRAVKAILKDPSTLGSVAREAIREPADEGPPAPVDSKRIEAKVTEAVRDAIKEAVQEALEGGQKSNGIRKRETQGSGRIP